MASSALRSGLRSTACMQAVDLKTKLHLRLTGRHRRSVENCGVTRSLPRSGPAATSLSGPSNWPSAGGGGIAATSWHASRTCGTAWAKALRWDIPQSRSLAGWRANMVVSSSAMSQSIVSSIIVRPRRITGTACCRAINSDEGAADAQAAALPASSNNDARSLNDPPRSKAAICRAIGKPTSCCSPDMAKGCWFSTDDKPASASFCTRSIEKPSSPLGPSPVNSANFHKRCAKPSASTTEPSSPSITGFTKPSVSKPSSAIPIVPGKKAAWKTPSGYYGAHCHVKLTSTPLRQPPSSGSFGASTIPHANAWTSRHPPRHSPNSNQSLHFKRDSISRPSPGRQLTLLAQPHDHVDPGDLVALGHFRHLLQHQMWIRNVDQFVVVFEIEVVMRGHVGVEIGLGAVDADLAQQASIGQLVERVVDGRERHRDLGEGCFLVKHFRGEMACALAEQQP